MLLSGSKLWTIGVDAVWAGSRRKFPARTVSLLRFARRDSQIGGELRHALGRVPDSLSGLDDGLNLPLRYLSQEGVCRHVQTAGGFAQEQRRRS